MKVAFPTQHNKNIDSPVYGHFGSAPHFVIVDSESGAVEVADNPDRDHLHGQCEPLKALSGKTVDVIVAGGIGAGALNKLNASGIKTYRAIEGSVSENLELIKSGLLPLFAPDHTCAGHGEICECIH